jgi:hypothetical protein
MARRRALAVLVVVWGGNALAQQSAPPVEPEWWPGKVQSAAASAPGTSADLASGAAWQRLLGELARAGEVVQSAGTPATDLDRAEGYRHLGALLRSGLSNALLDFDPDHPRFHFSDESGKWGLDCADALYAQAAVRGGAEYRVRARRGSAQFMGFQLMAGIRPVADVDADSLERDADGSFEIVLSKDRRPGNWIQLSDDATILAVRQFFYDWDREQPGSLWIERVDAARVGSAPAPQTSAPVVRWLDALGQFVRSNADYWKQVSVTKRTQAPNTFPAANADPGIGAVAAAGQRYQASGVGYWVLAEDEALIVEVTPPKAKYWSLHLGNFWMESLDFASHQSSLNGHQARLDADGVFRAVIARRDPGVPNWLDPAGHAEGAMIYRWNQADGSPVPATRLVKLSALRDALPRDTPRVSPEERAAAMERRRAHVQRRYARPL